MNLLTSSIRMCILCILFNFYSQKVQRTEINVDSGSIFTSVTADRPKSGLKSVLFGKNLSTVLKEGKSISAIEHLSFIPIKNTLSKNFFGPSSTKNQNFLSKLFFTNNKRSN